MTDNKVMAILSMKPFADDVRKTKYIKAFKVIRARALSASLSLSSPTAHV